MKIIKTIAISSVVLATFFTNSVNAQSIFNGLRGPTNFQIDNRISYSSIESLAEEKNETFVINNLLKYWDGNDKGIFAFANFSNSYTSLQESIDKNLKSLSLGIGPRFRIDLKNLTLNCLSYFGPVINFDDEKRIDYQAGLLGTFLDNNGIYQVDFSLTYYFNNVKELSDRLSVGFVLGGIINENFRLVGGPVFNYQIRGNNDGDFISLFRSNLRYTPSNNLGEKIHLELIVDNQFRGNVNNSQTTSSAIIRYNF